MAKTPVRPGAPVRQRTPVQKVKALSPAMQMRVELIDAYNARGHNLSNLWLAESVRVTDGAWILTSDSEFLHFLHLEFDPTVQTFDLSPDEVIVRIGPDDRKTKFDAVVEFVDGRRECREVKVDEESRGGDLRTELQYEAQIRASQLLGADYVRVYGAKLATEKHRIWNSARMLRCIRAAQGHATQKYRNSCGSRLEAARDGLTIAELIEPFEEHEHPLAKAAIYKLLSERLVTMDIDHEPVCEATMVRIST